MVDAVALLIDAAVTALLCLESPAFAVTVAAQDVEADGHLQILGCGPEGVIVVRSEWKLGRRHLPDNCARKSRFTAAVQLLHRPFNVVHREHRQPDETVGRRLAVFYEPVVVDAGAGCFKFGIVEAERLQAMRGVENFRADAVGGHFIDGFVPSMAPG